MIKILLAIIAILMAGPEQEKPYVVIYPIQDLEMVLPNYTEAPQLDLSAILSGNNQGSIFRDGQPQNIVTEKNSQAIIELIENIVEPEVWGTEATIRYWKGNLIINAPKRIHDKIY